VHEEPPVYLVPHFLTAKELDHFDELITCEVKAIKNFSAPLLALADEE